MRRFFIKHALLPATVLFIVAAPADAGLAEAPGCAVETPTTQQQLEKKLNRAVPADDEVVRVTADRIESVRDEVVILIGNVVIMKGPHRIQTDRAVYKKKENTIEATGNVKLDTRGEGKYSSEHSFLNLNDNTGYADLGGFSLSESRGRGHAERIVFVSKGRLKLKSVRFTTCRPESEDWYLKASEIDINQNNATGAARNSTLKLMNVPIFYWPYVSFPLGDNRRSGFLLPDFGNTDKMVTYITVPYYWNIAPNYDATIRPRYMSNRGVQLQTEFRYLGDKHNGIVEIENLPNDSVTGTSRTGASYKHDQQFSEHLRANANLNWVSDQDYFDDFSTQLSASSQTHLPQSVNLNYQKQAWQIGASFFNYQTIDKSVLPSDYPYARLPQFTANWRPNRRSQTLNYQLHGSATAFEHNTEETARRMHLRPSISFPVRKQYGFINPKITGYFTSYMDRSVGSDASIGTGIGSLDAGLMFDRPISVGSRAVTQTLEPRLFYVYSPFVDQSALPVFDSALPAFNFNSLFQENRFLGSDRVGDTHQLTLALTSRLLDDETGAERLTASLGQTYYFADRVVSSDIPASPVQTAGSSDIAAEISAWLGGHWYIRSSLLWDSEANATRKNNQFLQYQPAKDRILNIGYRFEDTERELVDISTQWPITSKWTVLARSQYSLRDKTNQDSYAGLRYDTCCWAFRSLYGRRVDQAGIQVTSFSFQLIFKGLAGFETGLTSDLPLALGVTD
jgi:LPS-assembly protein